MNRGFEIKHIFREANKIVDRLAHMAQGFPFGIHILNALSANIVHALASDKIGI